MKKLLLFLLAGCAWPQTTTLLPWTPTQFFDASGRILPGGKVCTYIAGTSTGLATFTDATGTVSNPVPPNAIVLNSAGQANIWLSTDRSYKIVLLTAGSDSTCSTGTTLRTVDNVQGLWRYTATSIPTTGTWQTGDFVWNVTPSTVNGSASQVLGWINTAGGTPGTWVTVAPALGGNETATNTIQAGAYTVSTRGDRQISLFNADFEGSSLIPPPGWGTFNGPGQTLSYETSTPYTNKLQSLKIATTGSGQGAQYLTHFSVVPTDTYSLQCALKADGASTAQCALNWYDKNGSFVNQIVTNSASAAWALQTVTGAVPATAVQAVVALSCQVTCGANSVWFDEISVQKTNFSSGLTVVGSSSFSSTTNAVRPIVLSGDAFANNNSFEIVDSHAGGHTWDMGEVGGLGRFTLRDLTQTGTPMWSFNVTGSSPVEGILTHANTTNRTYTFPDGSGTVVTNAVNDPHLQTCNVSGSATAASAGATVSNTCTWQTAFSDASYNVTCSGLNLTSGTPVISAITNRLAGSVAPTTMAVTAAASQFGTILCIAIHP